MRSNPGWWQLLLWREKECNEGDLQSCIMCSTAEIGFPLLDSESHERETKFNIRQHLLLQIMPKNSDCGNKTVEKWGREKKGVSPDYTGSGIILCSLWLKWEVLLI